jgi:hypothetical protein
MPYIYTHTHEVVSKIFRSGAAIYNSSCGGTKNVSQQAKLNSWFYCDVLRRLHENLRIRRPELGENRPTQWVFFWGDAGVRVPLNIL